MSLAQATNRAALPAGGVREGMEWTDTTEYRLTADAFPGTERAVTTYKAAPADASGGKKGVTLQSTGSGIGCHCQAKRASASVAAST